MQRLRRLSETLFKPSVSTPNLQPADSTIYSAPHSRPSHQGGKPFNKEDIRYPLIDGGLNDVSIDDPIMSPYAQLEARINARRQPLPSFPPRPEEPLRTSEELAAGWADNSAQPVQFPRMDSVAGATSTDARNKPLPVAPLNIRKINSIDNTRLATTTTATVRHDTRAHPVVTNRRHQRSASAQQLHTTFSRPQESKPRAADPTTKHRRAESVETSPPKRHNLFAAVASMAQSLLGEANNKQTSRTPIASPDIYCSTTDATVRRQPAVKRSASAGGTAHTHTSSNSTIFAGGHRRTPSNVIWLDRPLNSRLASDPPPNVEPHTVPCEPGSGPSMCAPSGPARAHTPVSPQAYTIPPREPVPPPPSFAPSYTASATATHHTAAASPVKAVKEVYAEVLAPRTADRAVSKAAEVLQPAPDRHYRHHEDGGRERADARHRAPERAAPREPSSSRYPGTSRHHREHSAHDAEHGTRHRAQERAAPREPSSSRDPGPSRHHREHSARDAEHGTRHHREHSARDAGAGSHRRRDHSAARPEQPARRAEHRAREEEDSLRKREFTARHREQRVEKVGVWMGAQAEAQAAQQPETRR